MVKLDDLDDKTLDRNIETFQEKTNLKFVDFYVKYLPKLTYYNNNFLKDFSKSQDIAIDSFLKSLKKIDDYNPSKSFFSTWLFTISRNECIQYLNKNKRLISSDKKINEDGTSIKDFIEDTLEEDTIDHKIQETNLKKGEILKEKVNLLKSPYKEVITLRDIQGKTYREITIIYRQEKSISLSKTSFQSDSYKEGVLSLYDPEKKEKTQPPKFYSISFVGDSMGNPLEYKIISKDKDGLISKVELPKNSSFIYGEIPFNMSTLKSQIRNGRILLKKMVKEKFKEIETEIDF